MLFEKGNTLSLKTTTCLSYSQYVVSIVSNKCWGNYGQENDGEKTVLEEEKAQSWLLFELSLYILLRKQCSGTG